VAHIIPSDLTRAALAGAKTPELDTLRLLKDALSNDYTVFHGVHWTREYRSWTHFGEIDFVVINRAGEVLFIEQKNGALEEGDAGLTKQYEDRSQNPVEQVHRSIEKVRDKFTWQHGRATALAVDYLVYLPDHRLKSLNAVGLDEARIVDATAKGTLPARIAQLLGPGAAGHEAWRERVFEFFRQSYELVPDIQAHHTRQSRNYVRCSGPLADVLANLEMAPFRLRVRGTAGCGKSLMAGRFIERQPKDRRILSVCFNRPLAERRRGVMGARAMVNTFHGFCREFLASRGHDIDFSTASTNPGFWRELQERVTGEEIPDAWRFDTLVVDEGQDFEQEWWETLQLFLRDGADVLWLEDPDQNLQGRPPVALDDFVGFRARVNYRNPDSIARYIRSHLPFDFEPGNDLPGLGVGEHACEDPADQPRVVARILQDLVRQGFSHDDIVILTCHGVQNSVFSTLDAVGGVKLRRFTGEYTPEGNQLLSEGRITFDSVYRFKGQEAAAVILVDTDAGAGPGAETERIERAQRVRYVGMTRATVRLDVVPNARTTS